MKLHNWPLEQSTACICLEFQNLTKYSLLNCEWIVSFVSSSFVTDEFEGQNAEWLHSQEGTDGNSHEEHWRSDQTQEVSQSLKVLKVCYFVGFSVIRPTRRVAQLLMMMMMMMMIMVMVNLPATDCKKRYINYSWLVWVCSRFSSMLPQVLPRYS